MTTQFNHVVNTFPELRRRILETSVADPDFRSVCEDYNRVCADLLQVGSGNEADKSISADLNRLRAELETEIAEMLTVDAKKPIESSDRRKDDDATRK